MNSGVELSTGVWGGGRTRKPFDGGPSGDLKLLNEENAVLAAWQKWASTAGHQTPDAPRCLCAGFLTYTSCCSGGLPSSPSIPFSQSEFSDPQAGPSFSDHFGLYLPVCIKLPPTRLEAFSGQGTDLIWSFCPVPRVVPGIQGCSVNASWMNVWETEWMPWNTL